MLSVLFAVSDTIQSAFFAGRQELRNRRSRSRRRFRPVIPGNPEIRERCMREPRNPFAEMPGCG